MLISALCSYYDTLAANGAFEDESLVEQDVSYMIFLSPDGTVADIIDYTEEVPIKTKKGTKTQRNKRKIKVPYHPNTTSVVAYLLDYRSEYIFGFAKKDPKKIQDGESLFYFYTKKHDAFVKTNLEFIEGVNSPIVNAYREFLLNWKAPEQVEGTIYQQVIGSCCCFALEGHPEIQLQKDSILLEKCRERFQNRSYAGPIGTCAITGLANQPIARTHGKIIGFSSGMGQGNILVCFDKASTAFSSYGKLEAVNSSISAAAAEKYVATLNWLLRTDGHHTNLDDMTLVYWADTENADADKAVCNVFDWNMDGKADREGTDSRLSSFMAKARVGELSASDLSAEGIDPSVSFYVAGLYTERASSRISVKFVYRNTVGKFAENIAQHQRDLMHSGIGDSKMYLGLLVKELFSPKSSAKNPSYPMYAAMMESILNGTRYPNSLLSTVVLRCRTDSDDKGKKSDTKGIKDETNASRTDSNDKRKRFYAINARRIALIKACLNRQARIMNKQEVIPMALDTENNSQAYVCGRLFALLEYAQKCANQKSSQKDFNRTANEVEEKLDEQNQKNSPKELNRTIKDSYFSSACTRPAVVFPRLMMLAQHHLEKAENGGYINGLIRETVDKLEGKFPSTLSLEEQGEFIVGYYQQNKKLYTKKEEN